MAIDARYGEFWRNRLEYHDWWSGLTAFLNARVPLALAARAREEKADEDFDRLYKYWTDLAQTQEGVVGRIGNLAVAAGYAAGNEAKSRRWASVTQMQEDARTYREWLEGEMAIKRDDLERDFQLASSETLSTADRENLNALNQRAAAAYDAEKDNDEGGAVHSAAAQIANGLRGILSGSDNVWHNAAIVDQAVNDFLRYVKYDQMEDANKKGAYKQILRNGVYNELGIPVTADPGGELSSAWAIGKDPMRERVQESARTPAPGPAKSKAPPVAGVSTTVPVQAAPATAAPVHAPPAATTVAPSTPTAPVTPAPTPSAAFVAPTPGATYQPIPGLDQAAPGPLAAQFGAAAQTEIARNQAMQDIIAARIKEMEAQRAARPDTSGQVALDLWGTRANPEQDRFDKFKAWYAKLTPEQRASFQERAQEAKRAKEYGKLGEGGRKAGEEQATTIMGDWSELQKQAGEWSAELAALEADQANRKVAGTEEGKAEIDKFYRSKADVIATLPPERRETVWTLWALPDDKARVQVAGYVAESDKKREAAKAKSEAEDFEVTKKAVEKVLETKDVWMPPTERPAVSAAVRTAEAVQPWEAPSMAEVAETQRKAETESMPGYRPSMVFVPVQPSDLDPWDAAERTKRYDALKAIDPATADARIKAWEDKQRAKAQEGANAQP